MNSQRTSLIDKNSVFIVIGAITLMLLSIPLIAMLLTNEVNWSPKDFLIMGLLIYTSSSIFVLIARKFPANRRWKIALFCLLAFMYIWAELAVGIFTNIGS